MDRPVTQIFAASLPVKRSAPSALTPKLMPKESQRPTNAKPTKKAKEDAGQEISRNVLRDHAQDLHHSSVRREGLAAQPLVIRESPWRTLKDLFTCDLAGPVSVAVDDKNPSKVIAVRAFSRKKADTWLQVLQQTQHLNVISARQIFKDHGMTYFIVDDLPLTLKHLVACDVFPSELQLASILVQVLDGILHLLENGFEHESLTCSNTLLGQDGVIQIAALEHCVKRQPNQSQAKTLRSLANITMLLMQKYLKPDGVIGIDDTRWQADPLGFLSATASVPTVQDLKRVSQASYIR
ncbi:hypothetical protein CNMCM5793_004951 [Aspergillus hiratsukae]|uniref:Protein kinase domain-containing protein n=1 Tax=Aspergillus hiratsukae TaxID=1194566 RepID=A0A8H6UZE5_9EURO|nr:hypothetical protein CNMCM5793_004951 [Aspergillus hiratsukae]KAF7172888.1 hypothetical protein CNMCM6106_007064 [Aspergillus hiratsukae]